MSPDEVFALIVSAIVVVATWGRWFFLRLNAPAYGSHHYGDTPLAAASALAAAMLFVLLANFSSHDVQDDWVYIGFYLALGGAATGLGFVTLDLLGLSLRDDAIERRNPAAALAIAGAIPGLTLAYAGSNIGDGPSWWVVAFCSILAIGGLLGGWIVLDRLTDLGETIVVERNRPAGLRVACWFVATGAILGRAAAGDWTGAGAAVRDFSRIGLGALGLLGFAAVIESVLRPRAGRPIRHQLWLHGIVPGLAFLCLASLYLIRYGRW